MAPDVETEPTIERLEERPIGVDPAAIEDEFSRIWRETSSEGVDESSVRMRVLNIVGLAHSAAGAERFEQVMLTMPERHPCRGMLAVTAAAYSRLEASISAHCWRPGGGRRHVCSEEVLLRGGMHQERELASAVLALLVPEVPVVAWLIDALDPSGYLAAEVLEAADTVVFDSAVGALVPAAFKSALAMAAAHDVRLADLAWGRLETWRALTAQIFDGEDGPRELDQLQSIEVRGGGGANAAEPMLLAGWLVSRLNLALADAERSDGTLAATLYDGARGVRLTVGPADQAMDELVLRTIDAEFTVQCHAESRHMHVREQWEGGSTRRAVKHMAADDASVMSSTLDNPPDPDVYESAVRSALALLGA